NVAIVGFGPSCNYESSLRNLFNRKCLLIKAASKTFLPQEISQTIKSYYPVIIHSMVSGNITISRFGISGNYESAIRRLLHGTSYVIIASSKTFLPLQVTIAIQFYDPIVSIAVISRNIPII